MITNFEIFEKYLYDENIVVSFIQSLDNIININNDKFYENVFYIKKYYHDSFNVYDFNINAFNNKLFSIEISYDTEGKIFFTMYKKNETIYNQEYHYNLIIKYLNNFLIHDYLSIMLNLNMNHYDRLSNIIINNIDNKYDEIIDLVLKKGLPKNIQDKYQYLTDANKFDLI